MTEIQEALQRATSRLKWKGKSNYLAAYAFYLLTAVSSVGASVWTAMLVSRKEVPSVCLPILTALPASAILIQDILQLEAKARWYYEKRRNLESLLKRSLFEGASDKTISEKWREIDASAEKLWPRFGRHFAFSHSQSNDNK